MTNQQIKEIVDKLSKIAETNSNSFAGINSVAVNPNCYKHGWTIDYDNSFNSSYSVKIDSIGDAVKIIHLFSHEPKDSILARLKYEKNKNPLYLHYHREL